MLANYLKIFLRLFLKQTVFTLINIVGLAVGLACCLVIALFVRHELSFDRFFASADNLYRVNAVTTTPNGETTEVANTFFPVAPLLADNFPDITGVARLDPHVSLISAGDSTFYENGFRLVDPAFFQLFDLTWLEGNPDSALSGAMDVVVTRSFAEKYFGSESALGQSVQMAQAPGPVLRVTGVIDDLPVNTHLTGVAFASMALLNIFGVDAETEWSAAGYYTYVTLRPGADVEGFQQELDVFARTNIPQPAGTGYALKLQPITDIHLNYTLGDLGIVGNKLTIAVFSAIGLGILLVACVNFVNLSTARSAQRFNEVGLRLTFGARRTQLLVQFLGESALFVLLALVLALVFVELTLPGIQALLGLDFAADDLNGPLALSAMVAAGLVLGLFAGWYPAVLMSGYKPVAVLKHSSRSELRGLALKNVLVVLQFAVAIGMLIGASVIYLQMRHAGTLDHGYASDNVVFVALDDRSGSFNRRKLLKERLQQGAGISAVTLSSSWPMMGPPAATLNFDNLETQHQLAYTTMDFDFLALFDIALLNGRLPDANQAGDLVRAVAGGTAGGNVVLNVSGAREFGWSGEEAVGESLSSNGAQYEVIGVLEDTIDSPYSPTRPAMYAVTEDLEGLFRLSVKLDANDVAGGMADLERIWKEVNPGEPIETIFMSELIEQRFRGERTVRNLVFVFAAITVVISCMGLFGLANFNAQRRIKEIGVRKVLGGSVWSIVWLLTNEFSKLVLVANLLAWPATYFVMNRWLENFAYRIDLTPLVFIGSGLIALCIAWVTVGGTAATAANQRPVLALRYE